MDGKKLQLERGKAGLTLAELSAKTGITVPQIHHLEQGRVRNPQIKTLVKLATALGLPADFFVDA